MTTNSSSPSPKPSSSSSSQATNKTPFIVAIVLLAVACLVLGISTFTTNSTKNEVTAKLTESEQLKAELEKQYYEALSELEEMRGSNEELNALIEQQKDELKTSKEKIDKLLVNSRNLDKARKEIQSMKGQIEGYVAEINQLREQNELLTQEKTMLSEENQVLATDLEGQRMTNAELSSEKALLVSEKEQLEQTRERLAAKVNIASVVKVNDLEVNGQKIRNSGKAVDRKNASNVEQLEICFNTTANEVTEPGVETFHIRVINPLGETIAVDDMGSGVFTNSANGEQIRYTTSQQIEYNREADNLCMTWKPTNIVFQQGNYEVEVYNKGYLAGTSSFKLN